MEMILGFLVFAFIFLAPIGFVHIAFSAKEKMSKSDINKKDFWKRQFHSETTANQKTFDYIFGIILPAICFFFDPVVFRSFDGNSAGIVGQYKPFVYILSFTSIIALIGFNLLGEKLRWLNGFFAGLFAVASLGAFVIGICMLPLSIMGLIIIIGALGFTPLFTGFVFWRNAVRAYKVSNEFLDKSFAVKAMILTGLFSLVVPMIVNIKIQRGLETLRNGNAAEIRRTANRLRFVAPITDFSKIYLRRDSHYQVMESEENTALAESYKMLTGREIERY